MEQRRAPGPTRPKFVLATRSTYSPVRVSTRIFSPSFTNSGTCTTAPGSIVAGLVEPEAVSPLMPGSVF